VSCTVAPACTEAELGVMETVATGTGAGADVTVMDAVALLLPLCAVIVADPGAAPVTKPVPDTCATLVLELDHLADFVLVVS